MLKQRKLDKNIVARKPKKNEIAIYCISGYQSDNWKSLKTKVGKILFLKLQKEGNIASYMALSILQIKIKEQF